MGHDAKAQAAQLAQQIIDEWRGYRIEGTVGHSPQEAALLKLIATALQQREQQVWREAKVLALRRYQGIGRQDKDPIQLAKREGWDAACCSLADDFFQRRAGGVDGPP